MFSPITFFNNHFKYETDISTFFALLPKCMLCNEIRLFHHELLSFDYKYKNPRLISIKILSFHVLRLLTHMSRD